ncbi:DUF3014 domain-containing protein [Motiliproteus coralliicola]|uniref:DUF3014 domain-containing protein n=1 Tax=Motiliproteus coralliicola TaxID=2283196 RepID=A0A369WLI1_9GAMM|nr:DUF3014 domain-containing protein [Motiliproteus coralliicola]RDE22507.1 DUF3014 domain-containing protein [Motiliproteus coralliicola]
MNIRQHSQRGLALVQVLLLLVTLLLAVGVGYLMLKQPPDAPLVSGTTQRPSTEVITTPVQPQTLEPVVQPAQPENQRVDSVVTAADTEQAPQSLRPEPVAAFAPAPALKLDDPSLPSLDNSDRTFRQDLAALEPSRLLLDWLIDKELIRKLVVTIDNMAQGKIPRKHSPLKPMSDKFRPSVKGEQIWLDGYNFGRYSSYLTLLEKIDSRSWVEIYRRYYPLMQQAYAELGYPRQRFHDRVLMALDHLLSAPVKPRALALAQPSVMFVYADPKLEQLSAVHKQMLRIGPVNAARVLEMAAVLRTELGRLQEL